MSALTPDELAESGRLLFGERWQSELAFLLGFSDASRVRQMLSGRRSIPAGVRDELVEMLRSRGAAAIAFADRLDRNAPGPAT